MKNKLAKFIINVLISLIGLVRSEILATVCNKGKNGFPYSQVQTPGIKEPEKCQTQKQCQEQTPECSLRCTQQNQPQTMSYLVYPQVMYEYVQPVQQEQQVHVQAVEQEKKDCCCCCLPEEKIKASKSSFKKSSSYRSNIHGGWQKRFAHMRKSRPFVSSNMRGRKLRKCTYRKRIAANLKNVVTAIRGTYGKKDDSSSSSEDSSDEEKIDLDECATETATIKKVYNRTCDGGLSKDKVCEFSIKNVSDGRSEAAQKPTYSDKELADEQLVQEEVPEKDVSFTFLKTISDNNLTDEDLENFVQTNHLDKESFKEGLVLSEKLQGLKSKESAIGD